MEGEEVSTVALPDVQGEGDVVKILVHRDEVDIPAIVHETAHGESPFQAGVQKIGIPAGDVKRNVRGRGGLRLEEKPLKERA
jgi:hypothetical protein